MKKTFATILAILILAAPVRSTPVLFNSQNFGGNVANRRILVTADQIPFPPISGTNNLTGMQFFLQPVFGQVITNLVPWGYTFQYDGWPRSVHVWVTDTTNIVNVVSLINTNAFAPIAINTGPVTVSINGLTGVLTNNNAGDVTLQNNLNAGALNVSNATYGVSKVADLFGVYNPATHTTLADAGGTYSPGHLYIMDNNGYIFYGVASQSAFGPYLTDNSGRVYYCSGGFLASSNGAVSLSPSAAGPVWSELAVSNRPVIWSSNDIPQTIWKSYFNVVHARFDTLLGTDPNKLPIVGGTGTSNTLNNATNNNSTFTGSSDFSKSPVTGLPIVSTFTNGYADTNVYLNAQSTPNGMMTDRLPWRGETVGSMNDVTNLISFFKTQPQMGFNIMIGFTQFYSNRVAGQLMWNGTNFPGTPASFKNMLHANGWRWGLWYDNANAGGSAAGSYQQEVADFQLLASWQPDILWIDGEGYEFQLAAQVFSTNRLPIQLMGAITPSAEKFVNQKTVALGNAFRLHCSRDVVAWSDFIEYADTIESSNVWSVIGPGHFIYLGPEAGAGAGSVSQAGLNSSIALQAMWGSAFLFGWCLPYSPYQPSGLGPWQNITNRYILQIQGDPAVVCARRVLVTNGCWVYLKPLVTANGPNYAVMILNTNSTSQTLTVPIPQLFAGQSNIYSVYDMKNDITVGDGQNKLTVTSLAAYDFALFQLIPSASPFGPQTVYYTPGMIDCDKNQFTRITHDTAYFGPFGPGNYYARDGWSESAGTGTHIYYCIPEWCSSVTVSYCYGSTGTATVSNIAACSYFDPANGGTGDANSGGINYVIAPTNGVQQVTYTVLCQPTPNMTQPHYLVDTWNVSTNSTSTRMILGPVKMTFR